MASSINASTTAGVVTTADTSGVLNIQTAGVTAITVDASQNVGLGVTPSAFLSTWKVFQIGYTGSLVTQTATNIISLDSNRYQNTSNQSIYIQNGYASSYYQYLGQHVWQNAPSGTAGNPISFTQAMTLNASGNLGITETSPTAKLHISVASAVVDGTKGVKITNPGGTAVMFECGVSGDSFIGTTSGSDFNIRTGNTVRATFDNAGNLLVGATSTLGSTAGILIAASGANVQTLTTNNTSGSSYYIGRFYASGAEKGYIYYNGSTVAFTSTSDYRLKEDVQPMTGALAKVAQLKPCTYTWKENGQAGQGFIAHELAEVVPDCVSGEKDAVDEDGTPRYQGIDTSFLVATLTAAIKEMKAIIDTQASTITQLQADVALLKGATP